MKRTPTVTQTPDRLDPLVEPSRDHVLGPPDAEITLVEYGSYVCTYCHAAHEVIRHLRDEFGDRLRYVYRHLPLTDRHEATQAAELAEYAAAAGAGFWSVHDTLMRQGPLFAEGELDAIAADYDVPARDERDPGIAQAAEARVRADARSGIENGARMTPTFFINGRRYEGAWDTSSLREAMLRSPGHRIQAASLDFARWAPSTGLLLLVMTVLALVLSNSPAGAAFLAFWDTPAGLSLGGAGLVLPLVDWVNHGLLTIFFLVVGLEVKRELTVGRLATWRAAAFPIAAALGGIVVPTIIFTLIAPEEFRHAWGVTIATDTAFAIAIMILLGERVPVDLRVFLTAAVIADDLVAIAVVAFFYSGALSLVWIAVSIAITAAMLLLNRSQVYRLLPYAALGVMLWVALHEAGIHATLAGVVLAMVTPTRPPPNVDVLLAQAQAIIDADTRGQAADVLRTGPSVPTLRALDAVHDRMESPAGRMLRAVEPWSSYGVLPIFALANAGVVWSLAVVADRWSLVAALSIALVVGKPLGVLGGGALAVRLGLSTKPSTYTWRQVAGAGALGGIGFTMSLFIASQAFGGADYSAAKIAIFVASIVAGVLGTAILWQAPAPDDARSVLPQSPAGAGRDRAVPRGVG